MPFLSAARTRNKYRRCSSGVRVQRKPSRSRRWGRKAKLWPSMRRMRSGRMGERRMGVRSTARSSSGELCAVRGDAQRGPVDAQGVAVVAEAAEQGADHLLATEEAIPVVVVQVRRDDRRLARIPLLHELEEEVRLLGAQVEIPHLIDQQHVDRHQAVQELARGAVREAGVHLVEQVLCPDEQTAVAVLKGLEQDGRGEPRLAHPRGTDKDDVLPLGDEVELAELLDRGLVDGGLRRPGEGLERPALGQLRAIDPVLEAPLLLELVLLAQQARVEFGVARLGLLGACELALDDLTHRPHLQVLEELFQIIIHELSSPSPGSSSSGGRSRKKSPATWRSTRASMR